jgi:glycosyltransferase involved in cell wall biosynthesis
MKRVLLFGDHRSPHVHKWAAFLEDAGAAVDVVGYGESKSLDSYSYPSLIDRKAMDRGALSALANLGADLALLFSRRYDAACFHFLTRKYALYILFSPIPTVLTCWGSDIFVDLPKAKGLDRHIRLRALREASRITCDSEALREAISEACPEAAARTEIVYWGVDTSHFRPDPEDGTIRKELGIPEGATVLLSNRLASPHYRGKEIVEQFVRSVRDEGSYLVVRLQPNCSRDYAEDCRRAAASCERIRFLERPIADSELPSVYRCADFALHFPRTDATPVSMLEALACGCDILCSDELASYALLEDELKLVRLPLAALDDEALRQAAVGRRERAQRNIAAIEATYSRAATVSRLRTIADSLSRGRKGGV